VYATVGRNGLKAWTEGVPLGVKVNPLLLLSTKRFDWNVNNETVPALTEVVRGEVGGVNPEV